jgi:hypothetical protein
LWFVSKLDVARIPILQLLLAAIKDKFEWRRTIIRSPISLDLIAIYSDDEFMPKLFLLRKTFAHTMENNSRWLFWCKVLINTLLRLSALWSLLVKILVCTWPMRLSQKSA